MSTVKNSTIDQFRRRFAPGAKRPAAADPVSNESSAPSREDAQDAPTHDADADAAAADDRGARAEPGGHAAASAAPADPITAFTKATLDPLMADIDRAVGEVLVRHGLPPVVKRSARFTPETLDISLKGIGIPRGDGVPADFARNAPRFGFDSSDFGETFKIGGKSYRLVDIKPRNRKYPIVGERAGTARRYKFPPAVVLAAMGRGMR